MYVQHILVPLQAYATTGTYNPLLSTSFGPLETMSGEIRKYARKN